jgi:hypothetical protein
MLRGREVETEVKTKMLEENIFEEGTTYGNKHMTELKLEDEA